MNYRTSLLLLTLLSFTGYSGATTIATSNIAAEESPAEAINVMIRAVDAGDMKRLLERLEVLGEQHQEFALAYSDSEITGSRLLRVIQQRFGDTMAAEIKKREPSLGSPMLHRYARAISWEINKDAAVPDLGPDGDRHPRRMIRINGLWKLDLTNGHPFRKGSDPSRAFLIGTERWKEIEADVNSGKIRSGAQVKEAFDELEPKGVRSPRTPAVVGAPNEAPRISKLTGEQMTPDLLESAKHTEVAKGTAFAVMLAIHDLDADALAKLLYADRDDGTLASAIADRIIVDLRLDNLVGKTFTSDDQAKVHLNVGSLVHGGDFFTLGLLNWRENGDRATAINRHDPQRPPIPMRKVDGIWKLDVTPEGGPAAVAKAIKRVSRHNAVLQKAVKGIESGKLKNITDINTVLSDADVNDVIPKGPRWIPAIVPPGD